LTATASEKCSDQLATVATAMAPPCQC